MPSASHEQRQLALRLRTLRLEHWQGTKLTQKTLASVLGGGEPLSPATVASWENNTAPKLPPRDRIIAYAQFFATRRSLAPATQLVPTDTFTQEELASYEALREELLRLHAAVTGSSSSELIIARRSWHFTDDGPMTLVCAQLPEEEAGPLANAANPNHTELMSFADLDAMVELWGHIRMENPALRVAYKSAPNVKPDDLSGHVVTIGGIGWNDVTRRLLDLTRLPVVQREDPGIPMGEIFVTEADGKERRYLPKWSDTNPTKLIEDVGLLVRMPNPLNSNRTLTMCNGIHSRGVYGAVRSLTDARLRDSNERYIARNFQDNQQFVILMRIQVIEGEAMTPDFDIPETVLYRWPTASTPSPAFPTGPRARG